MKFSRDLYGQVKEQRIITPTKAGSGQHQEVCNNQTQSFPFQYKRSQNSNSGKMILRESSPPSSQSAGFTNKVAMIFLAPKASSLSSV